MPPTQAIFRLTRLRDVITPTGPHGRLAHIAWDADDLHGRVVQVYVDDELAAVALDPSVRDALLTLDRGRAHRLELLAVDADAESPWSARPAGLRGWRAADADARRFQIIPDAALPIDAQVALSVDGGYPVVVPLFPPGATGAAPSATPAADEFGFDGGVGHGLGGGQLGAGPLGLDGEYLTLRQDALPAGAHTIALDLRDMSGASLLPQSITLSAPLAAAPPPAPRLWVDADLNLHWA